MLLVSRSQTTALTVLFAQQSIAPIKTKIYTRVSDSLHLPAIIKLKININWEQVRFHAFRTESRVKLMFIILEIINIVVELIERCVDDVVRTRLPVVMSRCS